MSSRLASQLKMVAPLVLLALTGVVIWYVAIRESPSDKVDKLLLEALASIGTFEFGKAETLLLQAVDIQPQNAVLRHRLAIVYLKRNQPAKARQSFEDAAALCTPDENELRADEYFKLADLDMQEHKYAEAENHLRLAIHNDPKQPLYHTRLIDLQLSVLGKPATADSSTGIFILACGRTTENLMTAAHVHWRRSSYGNAIGLSREVLIDADSLIHAHHIIANSFWKSGRPDSGLAHLEGVLERYPREITLWVDQANLFIGKKDYGSSLRSLDRALQIDVQHYEANLSRMMAFFNMGRYQEALAQITLCTSLTKDENELRFLRTQTKRINDRTKAAPEN